MTPNRILLLATILSITAQASRAQAQATNVTAPPVTPYGGGNMTVVCDIIKNLFESAGRPFNASTCPQEYAELDSLSTLEDINRGSISISEYAGGKKVLIQWILPILCTLGIIGNILCTILLLSQHLRTATSAYVAALVTAHTLQLITCFLIWSGDIVAKTNPQLGQKMKAYLFPYNNLFLSIVCKSIVALLTVIVGIERLLLIRFPVRAQRMALTRWYAPVILATALGTAATYTPNLMRYKPVDKWNPITNKTIWTTGQTEFSINNPEVISAHMIAVEVIFLYLPWTAAVILIGLVAAGLAQTKHRRKSATNSVSRFLTLTPAQQQTTRALLFIMATYVCCAAPEVASAIAKRLSHTFRMFHREHFLLMLLNQVILVLTALQGSINFPLLCAISENFRRALRHMFCCCCAVCCAEYNVNRPRTLSSTRFLPTSPLGEQNFAFKLEDRERKVSIGETGSASGSTVEPDGPEGATVERNDSQTRLTSNSTRRGSFAFGERDVVRMPRRSVTFCEPERGL